MKVTKQENKRVVMRRRQKRLKVEKDVWTRLTRGVSCHTSNMQRLEKRKEETVGRNDEKCAEIKSDINRKDGYT